MPPDSQIKRDFSVAFTEDIWASSVATRVLVPVANPATAEGLLRLAVSLVDDGGQVIAAYVMLNDAEPREGTLERIQEIIDRLAAEGHTITLRTDLATSIARGILDVAQEQGVDMIVLGIRGQHQGRMVLGSVVEAVARTTPCNLVVYRSVHPLYGGEGYRNVVVPVDGSDNSRLAMRIGARFAAFTQTPITALYVQTEASMRRWQALGRIEASLEGLTGVPAEVRKLVVHAQDVVSGVLSRAEPDTLLVLGFSESSSLDSWIFGDIPQRMLTDAPGPLFLVKQAVGESVVSRVGHRLSNALPTLTPAEVAQVIHTADEMARPTVDFSVLVVLSCLIASFGLLLNSSAVIIGAMLIAPLMSPLMGFGIGLTQGNWGLMRSAASTLIYGVLTALFLSWLVGMVSPLHVATPEMLGRGQPSLPDMAVALFSGVAGAYAVARKDIPAALAGVAIAAALMPPLCTVGLALAFGLFDMAGGAFFLFATNIVSISLAAAIVFLWLGVRMRGATDRPVDYRRRVIISVFLLLLMSWPLVASLQRSTVRAGRIDTVWTVLEQAVNGTVVDVQWQEGTPDVVATVRMSEPLTPEQVGGLQDAIHQQIGTLVNLELVILDVVTAPLPTPELTPVATPEE